MPRLESTPLRGEDFIFLLLLPLAGRFALVPKNRLFVLIAVYFLMNPAIYLAYYAYGAYELSYYPVILVKELEYFYIAYLMYRYGAEWRCFLVKMLDVMVFANVTYGIHGILFGEASYYGIGTVANEAAALSGGVYLLGTIWTDIRSAQSHRIGLRSIYHAFVAMGAICTLATISRSSILALGAYFASRFLLTRRNAPKVILLVAGAGLFLGILVYFGGDKLGVIERMSFRFARAESAGHYRLDKWMYELSHLKSHEWAFGRGKGFGNVVTQSLTLSVDSQYVRTILENGLFGVLLLLGILILMLHQIARIPGRFSYGAALCGAMATLCIPLEALLVSKIGTLFWVMLFYLYPSSQVVRFHKQRKARLARDAAEESPATEIPISQMLQDAESNASTSPAFACGDARGRS